MNRKLVLLCIISSFIYACDLEWEKSLPIEESEIHGRFDANFGESDTNFIDFLPDSTFIKYYKSESGELFVDTGQWKFSKKSWGGCYIELNNFIIRYPFDEYFINTALTEINDLKIMNKSFIVKKHSTLIYIQIIPNLGQTYKKIIKREDSS